MAFGTLVLLTLATVGAAYADNGPHGGYTATTDACAGCHRAHTAQGASLLTVGASQTDKSSFCYACHSGGTGAYTDVVDGVFLTNATGINAVLENTTIPTENNRPLRGGGFVNVKMNAGLTGTVTLSTTSRHMVTGGSNTVWGYDVLGTSGAGPTSVSLTCTSCHNPHGKAGAGNAATYRILKGNNTGNTDLFANGSVTKSANYNIPDEGTKSYVISDSGNNYFASFHGSLVAGNTVVVNAALTKWCVQCHTRYEASKPTGPGHVDSNDAIFRFRHPTNDTSSVYCDSCHGPMVSWSPPAPGCVTCHVTHGTGARMGTYSNAVAFPDGVITTTADARSSLLRLDNRGVCQGCHNK